MGLLNHSMSCSIRVLGEVQESLEYFLSLTICGTVRLLKAMLFSTMQNNRCRATRANESSEASRAVCGAWVTSILGRANVTLVRSGCLHRRKETSRYPQSSCFASHRSEDPHTCSVLPTRGEGCCSRYTSNSKLATISSRCSRVMANCMFLIQKKGAAALAN